jgi:hypothetical protein
MAFCSATACSKVLRGVVVHVNHPPLLIEQAEAVMDALQRGAQAVQGGVALLVALAQLGAHARKPLGQFDDFQGRMAHGLCVGHLPERHLVHVGQQLAGRLNDALDAESPDQPQQTSVQDRGAQQQPDHGLFEVAGQLVLRDANGHRPIGQPGAAECRDHRDAFEGDGFNQPFLLQADGLDQVGYGQLAHKPFHVATSGHDASTAVQDRTDPPRRQALCLQHAPEALWKDASVERVDDFAIAHHRHAQGQDGPARDRAGEQVSQARALQAEHVHQAAGATDQGQGRAPGADGVELLGTLRIDQHVVGHALKGQHGLGLSVESTEVALHQRLGGGQHLQACGDAGQVAIEVGCASAGLVDHLAHGFRPALFVVLNDQAGGHQRTRQDTSGDQQREIGAHAPRLPFKRLRWVLCHGSGAWQWRGRRQSAHG